VLLRQIEKYISNNKVLKTKRILHNHVTKHWLPCHTPNNVTIMRVNLSGLGGTRHFIYINSSQPSPNQIIQVAKSDKLFVTK